MPSTAHTASPHAPLDHPALWRGEACARTISVVSTGFSALDQCLPGGGWPAGALTELIPGRQGIGELALLMPACARLTREGRQVVFVSPPYIPYAPALAAARLDLARLLLVRAEAPAERLWAVEQALKAKSCGAVLTWIERGDERAWRRLQLACEQGGTCAFLFLPAHASARPSPAALRLALELGDAEQLAVRILKRRGSLVPHPILLDPRAPR